MSENHKNQINAVKKNQSKYSRNFSYMNLKIGLQKLKTTSEIQSIINELWHLFSDQ